MFKFQYETVMVLHPLVARATSHIKPMNKVYLFHIRYHFNKDCLVVQWSGDNPNSVAGTVIFS